MNVKYGKVIALIMALIFVAGLAYAAAPEKITLKANNGNVTLNHKAHSAMKDVTCKTCHHTATGTNVDKKCSDCHKEKSEKIPSMKDAAHNTCKTCHTKLAKGPTKCMECHKK